ncbi:MAG: 5-guanidino-2-oxopentanoate decarboxylase [Pseudomonadota bacterium]
MNLGQRLIRWLEAYGVEHVFGIPGVHTVELYRGLATSPIRHITPRHEQGAGFMADGYARVSGKPGVCLLITGPGLSNAATAMGQALADSIPMLVITGVNPSGSLGSRMGHLHELPNQSAFAAEVSVFSQTIFSAAQLDEAMARAFAVFASARPGPVHLEIPIDLMATPADGSLPTVPPVSPPALSPEGRSSVAALLSEAKAPVILAGGGVRDAAVPLRALAEALDAPVVQTVNARGVLPHDHPLSVCASPSLEAVRRLIDGSDVVLAVGTELGPTDYGITDRRPFQCAGALIRIDIDPQQLARFPGVKHVICADAGLALTALAEAVLPRAAGAGAARAEAAIAQSAAELPLDYRRCVEIVDRLWAVAPTARIVGDSTRIVYAGNLLCRAPGPGRWFGSSSGFGTLGFALPAAIGAKLADMTSPVIGLIGDGGLQFTLSEMASAPDANAPVILLVWNNQGYQEIKSFMIAGEITPEGVDLFTPDFQMIAKAMGWGATRLSSLDELEAAFGDALADGRSHLIELPEEVALAGLT